MVKSLWTGASGMTAQQASLDNIANNLSNVNTTGYKKQTTNFSTLLYQKLQTKTTDNNGDPKPVIGQVGSGVRVSGMSTVFTQGPMLATDNEYDMCISGNGFFRVRMPDGTTAYTRNGAFQMSMGTEGVTLCNADGYPVLDVNGEAIAFNVDEYDINELVIDEAGNFRYPAEDGGQVTVYTLGLAQFNNPGGLEKIYGSLLRETESSGVPRLEAEDGGLRASKVYTKYLEGSNVQTVDEIVNLITTQRAYEMNSKVITASDEMMQQANNLRS